MNLQSFAQSVMLMACSLLSISAIAQPLQIVQDSTASIANQTDDNNPKTPFYKGVQIGMSANHVENGFVKYEPETKIVPTVFYEGKRIYVRGNQLGVNAIKSDTQELSAYVQTSGDPFDPKNAQDQYQGLNKTKGSIMAGGSYLYLTRFGGLRAQMATEIAGESKGSLVKLTYLAKFQKRGLTVIPTAGVTWYDKNYNDYYYGISQAQADKTGLQTYKAGADINPFVSVMATYDMDDDLSLFLNQNVSLHGDEQLNSPKVNERISSATTIGLLYTF